MIIVLQYSPNTCYTQCVDPGECNGLSVNVADKTWTYRGQKYAFGRSRYCEHGCRSGVISVFDVKTPEDIGSIIYASHEATADRNYIDD